MTTETQTETPVIDPQHFISEVLNMQSSVLTDQLTKQLPAVIKAISETGSAALLFGIDTDPDAPTISFHFTEDSSEVAYGNGEVATLLAEHLSALSPEELDTFKMEYKTSILNLLETYEIPNIGLKFAINLELVENTQWIARILVEGQRLTDDISQDDLYKLVYKLSACYIGAEEFFIDKLGIEMQ